MAAETTAPLTEREADRLFAQFASASGLGLAVSGGADSVALMRLAAAWRARNHPELPVVVFTVDHRLRSGSGAEAARVADWARDVGLDHETLAWEGDKPRADIQAAAREARYRLLAEACAVRELSHLVLAHHLEDQAETLLLRLARGSGVDGLAAMSETTPGWPGLMLVRPLLGVPKQRLVATLDAIDQPWIEDPSNADPRFARARIRALMPALAGEGMTANRLAETARRMRRARSALESTAADLHRAAVVEDPAGFCRIDLETLLVAHEEIGLRVLARLLMSVGGADYPPRLERLERLYAALRDDTATGATLAGCRVSISDRSVLVCRERGRAGLPIHRFSADGLNRQPVVWDRRFRIVAGGNPPGLTAGGLTVRALGAEGVAAIRKTSRLRAIPVTAARVAPGVFANDRLLAAPLVEAGPGPYSPPDFAFAFVGTARFATGRLSGGAS